MEVLGRAVVDEIDANMGHVQKEIIVIFFGYLQHKETYWIGAVYQGQVWNVIFLKLWRRV